MTADAATVAAWHAYRNTVAAYFRRRLGDAMLAEDLTQETFLRMHRVQPRLQDGDHARAWLLRTARNLWVDHLRARKLELPFDAEPLPPEEASPAWRAFEPCIEPLAQRLPDHYRSALLWDLDGVPQQEIAVRQGIGLSGAKSRVQRARGLLAHEFARCCDDLPDPDSALFGCAASTGTVPTTGCVFSAAATFKTVNPHSTGAPA